MAQKNSSSKSRKSAGTSSASSKNKNTSAGGKKYKAEKKTVSSGKGTVQRRSAAASFAPFVLIFLGVLIIVSFFIKDFGVIGNFIRDNILFGFFSMAAYILPVILISCGVFMLSSKHIDNAVTKTVCLAVLFVLLCAVFHILLSDADVVRTVNPVNHYKNGVARVGGGLVGGFFGGLLALCFSRIGAAVIDIAAIIVLVLVIVGMTPKEVFEKISFSIASGRERRLEMKEQRVTDTEYIPENELDDSYGAAGEYVGYVDYVDDDEYYGEVPAAAGGKRKNTARDTLRRKSGAPEYDGNTADNTPVYDADNSKRKNFDPTSTDDDFPAPDVQLEIPDDKTIPDAIDDTDFDGRKSSGSKKIEPSFESADDDRFDSLDDESLFEDPEDDELVKRLSRYYLDGDSGALEVTESVVSEITPKGEESDKKPAPEKPEKKEPEYVFPVISLLTEDKKKKNIDYSRELKEKEDKLIETLEKFNVHTDSAGLPSKGPSITRYELRPAPGTRVRSIVNLVDDIALSLATSGIRIEAPIPGKSAVGIEVPNDVRETVRLRTLIDTDAFRNAQSKLNVALGEDVAGTPVYFDISKMPHLLIAGATGMGKSVCINCLLVSLLYKATPDEVKLILIDPKMVEFTVYGDIPHLLVPVVSDPKKAAGALSWAVSEMERRYGLLNAAGVRNIFGYNEALKDDPTKEKLSQIVIVIDELADLMMTAPDSVEDSIARIAQKARAAGMHLIIGTQRPSVDIITGTIKNNIPSRIACTVASQIDSRTIIDMAGAEKLIGRGDMLFNPVGATKPIRVQGAFVEDGEVESIVEFIKKKNSVSDGGYSDDIMTQIESAAEKCVAGKKRSGGGAEEIPSVSSDDEDPMFWKAVELAVDSGKISTSLIQRKCSLGFGRAAKLIDRMEALGYVSAPDGQKPRQVRLTRDQLDEILASGGAEGQDFDDDDDAPF